MQIPITPSIPLQSVCARQTTKQSALKTSQIKNTHRKCAWLGHPKDSGLNNNSNLEQPLLTHFVCAAPFWVVPNLARSSSSPRHFPTRSTKKQSTRACHIWESVDGVKGLGKSDMNPHLYTDGGDSVIAPYALHRIDITLESRVRTRGDHVLQ